MVTRARNVEAEAVECKPSIFRHIESQGLSTWSLTWYSLDFFMMLCEDLKIVEFLAEQLRASTANYLKEAGRHCISSHELVSEVISHQF